MTHPSPHDRVYARSTAVRSPLGAAAQRATQLLARRDIHARELSDLARWEGEGGAARPRKSQDKAARAQLSFRSAMASSPRVKPAPVFAAERNKGPAQRRSRQSAPSRPMNTHRGGRSR